MKTPSLILIAAVFAWSGATLAAEPASAQSAPAATQMAPHSHMQEKTGVKPPAKADKDNKAGMDDKSRHLHQRDAK